MQFISDFLNLIWYSISNNALEILIYTTPILIFVYIFHRLRSTDSNKNLDAFIDITEAGLTEPASLHPVIDPNICIGCGSCVTACPEGNVLGLIEDKARLINATHCIGHGACKTACPIDAITLVFGTEKRGVDIPVLQPNFETAVPGIFIAGELGGMGLIRNAITQGRQAMDAIKKSISNISGPEKDVVIIGAGPAGFSASLGALEAKLNFVTIEQEELGGTVAQFPRGKLVMTAPVDLPIIGKVKMTEIRKEPLIEFWKDVEKKTGVKINYQERMDMIEKTDNGLIVKTTKNTYHTKAVLLSIGRRGSPRKLGVPGEEQTKVVYRLIDPEQYKGMHVLVVGGGNSALEAAVSIGEEEGTTVTLSYRSDSFSRAAEKNRDNVSRLEKEGRLTVMLKSNVKNIGTDDVTIIDVNKEDITIPNEAIIVSAGGILPTPFLKKIGITVENKKGTP